MALYFYYYPIPLENEQWMKLHWMDTYKVFKWAVTFTKCEGLQLLILKYMILWKIQKRVLVLLARKYEQNI